jgi:predicted dehydrogenase
MVKIRVGIIGVGTIAKVGHLPNYAKRHDVEVVAFADPETERVTEEAKTYAQTTGQSVPTVYADAVSMLQNETLDAVSICTPNTSHVELAIQALKAGVHVLLEKPMATDLQDAEKLVDTAKNSGKILMVGMSHRYREDVEVLKRYIDNGDLGDIYYAKTRILRRRGTPKGWFTDKEKSGGGPLMDIGVHALDLTWWMLGCPKVSAVNGYLKQGIGNDQLDFIQTWTASSSGNQQNEIFTTEDFASAFIRLENGSVLQLEVSWALNGPEDDAVKVELFGTKGGLSLDPVRFYTTGHNVLTSHTPTVGMGALYQREINHFLECVVTGTSPCSDVEQGRDIVAVLTAIEQSSNEKKEIQL